MSFNINEVFETMKVKEKEKRENIIHAFCLRKNILLETEHAYFIKECFDDKAAALEFLGLNIGGVVSETFKEIQRHDWLCAHLELMGIDGVMFFENDSTHNRLELLVANKDETLAEKIEKIISWPEFESMKKVCYDASPSSDGFIGMEIYYIRPEDGQRGLYTLELPEPEFDRYGPIYGSALEF